jgi:succinyl-diaminopimelate desuccinylase
MKLAKGTETLEQILADLVAFRTMTGEHQAAVDCLDYAEAYLAKRGMRVTRQEYKGFPSLIATTRRTKKPTVLLQAHIDVVSAPDSCYKLREEDGKLFGRGVFDMKFAAAVFLKTVDELQDRLLDYNFGIMLTSDEEVGGKDGVKTLLEAGYGADICLLPDAGDDWHIETGCKGYWRVRASTTGVAAHGSRPWEGDNAIDRLVDALCDIRELFEGQSVDSDTFSVNQIRGGNAANQVPDKAQVWFDLRYIDKQGYKRLRKTIETIALRHDVVLETIAEMEVSNGNIDHPLVTPFLRTTERLRGRPLKPIRSLGGSDARYFAKHSIPVILVRPDGGGAHADGEWIDKAGLETYYQVVKTYVETVCATTASSR